MRIGLDATIISTLRNGVGVYAQNLVRELVTNSEHHYVAFVQRSQRNLWAPSERLTIVSGPRNQKWSRLYYEQAVMPRLARHHGIELLHSLNYTAPVVRFGVPSVVSVLDLTTFLFPSLRSFAYRTYMQTLVRYSITRATRLIAISESTAEDLTRVFGVPRERIDVTPLAFDASVHPTSDRQRVEATLRKYGIAIPYLLYVGRLDACKNLVRLTEAFAQFRRRTGWAGHLVLAGRPWNASAAIAATVERLGLRECVRMTGHVADEELSPLYSGALGFVFPSLYEGFGIPILEAYACNLPVLTSRTSSMPEVAGDAALFADPYSVDDLALKLEQLTADPALRTRLIQAGKARLGRFSWKSVALGTLETYEKINRPSP